MNHRIFTLNKEYCMIHYPEKPNGFGILIIGGEDQYVDEEKSHWITNNRKFRLLKSLLNEGYLIFYPSLKDCHPDYKKGSEMAGNLYEYIKRTEILNEKIHLIVEGAGAIILRAFLNAKRDSVRSIIFINPVFSFQMITELLENEPFLYKKFLQKVQNVYSVYGEECEDIIKKDEPVTIQMEHPYQIIHIMEHGMKDEAWLKKYKKVIKEPLEIVVLLPEKREMIPVYAKKLFKRSEHQL